MTPGAGCGSCALRRFRLVLDRPNMVAALSIPTTFLRGGQESSPGVARTVSIEPDRRPSPCRQHLGTSPACSSDPSLWPRLACVPRRTWGLLPGGWHTCGDSAKRDRSVRPPRCWTSRRGRYPILHAEIPFWIAACEQFGPVDHRLGSLRGAVIPRRPGSFSKFLVHHLSTRSRSACSRHHFANYTGTAPIDVSSPETTTGTGTAAAAPPAHHALSIAARRSVPACPGAVVS
jgi:hypothetical protein